MRYYVNFNKLEDLSNELIEYIRGDLTSEIENVRSLEKKLEWEGQTHDIMSASYNDLINRLKKSIGDIEKYVLFLQLVVERYKEGNKITLEDYLNFLETRSRLR